MEDLELEELLRIEEHALRAKFRVTSTDSSVDLVLRDVMLAAWPAFILQVRQEASVQAGTDSYSVTYARAGVVDFTFPDFVSSMLEAVRDKEIEVTRPESAAASTSTRINFTW